MNTNYNNAVTLSALRVAYDDAKAAYEKARDAAILSLPDILAEAGQEMTAYELAEASGLSIQHVTVGISRGYKDYRKNAAVQRIVATPTKITKRFAEVDDCGRVVRDGKVITMTKTINKYSLR